jgi:tRNA threonylcarbamoyl adenosine modification protein (Sua5/YciO/YrdC/YwlC family)
MLLEVDLHFPQPGIVEHAIEVIKERHGLIVFPTDTIYGIGCDIKDTVAIAKLDAFKQRSDSKNYSIIVKDLAQLNQYTKVDEKQAKVLKEFLPGAFTLILKASEKVPTYLLGPNGTIGIRLPRNRLCRALVKELGRPLITTSFNLSGQEVYTDPELVPEEILNQIDVVLDAENLGTKPSTLIDLTGDEPVILRQGKGIFI